MKFGKNSTVITPKNMANNHFLIRTDGVIEMKHDALITAGRILENREKNHYLRNEVTVLKDKAKKQKAYADSYNFYNEFIETLLEEEKKTLTTLDAIVWIIISNEKRIKSLRFAFFEEKGKEETKHMLDIAYSDIPKTERNKILDSIVAKKI